MRRPQLTNKEWDAIIAALGFVDAGEDPWEDELEKGEEGPSPTMKAVRSALSKLQR